MSFDLELKKNIDDINFVFDRLCKILDKDLNLFKNNNIDIAEKSFDKNKDKYFAEMEKLDSINKKILKCLDRDLELKLKFQIEIEKISRMYKFVVSKLKIVFSYFDATMRNDIVFFDIVKKNIIQSLKLKKPYNENGKLICDHDIVDSMDALYLRKDC